MKYGRSTIEYGKSTEKYGEGTADYGKGTTGYVKGTGKYDRGTAKYGRSTMGCGRVKMSKMDGFVRFWVKIEDLREACGIDGWGCPLKGEKCRFLPSAGDVNRQMFFTA